MAVRILPGTVHRMEAVTDVDILEASTPELDDVVRLEDRYGRAGEFRATGMRPGIHGLLDAAAVAPERWSVLLLVILLPSVACSQESPTSGLVVSSDAALQETANALLEDISERSGFSFTRPVRVEWRSEEELVRYLTFKLDEEFQEGEVERIRDSYALLGLVPETLDLGALFLALYTEQVGGFYDPDSVALYVRSGQDEATVESVLVHELVHAAQDQAVDLDALTERAGRGNDRQTAAPGGGRGATPPW